MSKSTYKSKPLPIDPESQEREADRQAELTNSDSPYMRGMLQAQAQERSNAQHALNSGLADLKRTTLNRDTTVAARDSYDRCWKEVERRAARVASIMDGAIGDDGKVIDGAVTIPAWLPPPAPTKADTIIVRAPRPSTSYAERAGLSPDGTGLPLRGPGSNVDPEWINK